MAKRLLNTAFSAGVLKVFPAELRFTELSNEEAASLLKKEKFENIANPAHENTLSALQQRLGMDLGTASGARVTLNSGDKMIVGQVVFPPSVPRETREYTDEQLALGKFSFLLVEVK